MHVRTDDGFILNALPYVVHTWCAHALFDCNDVVSQRQRVVDAVRLRRKLIKGANAGSGNGGASTVGTHRCVFCKSSSGYMTFCREFLGKPNACVRCRDSSSGKGKSTSNNAFHPSCAVWNGMIRHVRRKNTGMLCAKTGMFGLDGLAHAAVLNQHGYYHSLGGINHMLMKKGTYKVEDFHSKVDVRVKTKRFLETCRSSEDAKRAKQGEDIMKDPLPGEFREPNKFIQMMQRDREASDAAVGAASDAAAHAQPLEENPAPVTAPPQTSTMPSIVEPLNEHANIEFEEDADDVPPQPQNLVQSRRKSSGK